MESTEIKNPPLHEGTFEYAVNGFYYMNPPYPLWIFGVFYLAKKHLLAVINNYDLTHENILICVFRHQVDGKEKSKWDNEGITHQCLVFNQGLNEEEVKVVSQLIKYSPYNFKKDNSLDNRLWDPSYLMEIGQIFSGLSQLWFDKNSRYAFDYIVSKAQSWNPRYLGEFYQPVELTQLVCKILNPKLGSSIYNPYAGMCSYGMELDDNLKYCAQEMDTTICALAKLRLWITNKKDFICTQADSIKNWAGDKGFDYIIATPPFGSTISGGKTVESDFFYRSAKDCNHKAIGVYSLSICSRGEARIKSKELVKGDLIETVMLLPPNIFATTAVTPVIIIVNKNKRQKGKIRFINAQKEFEKVGSKSKLNTNSITALYHSDNEINGLVKDVELDEVINNKCNLYPKLYLTTIAEPPQGYTAHRIGEFITGYAYEDSTKKPKFARVVNMRQARELSVDGQVEASSFTYTEFDDVILKFYKRIVTTDCLLFNKINPSSSIYLANEGEDVFVPRGVVAVKIDTNAINPKYFISELSKDYLTEQYERFASSIFSIEDFSKCVIFVPDDAKKQQELVFEAQKLRLEKRRDQLELDREKLLVEFKIEQRERKHAILQVLNDIVPSIKIIRKHILNHPTITKDDIISQRYGTTLEEYLTSLTNSTDRVVDMVGNLTSTEEFGIPEDIDLYEWLPKYCALKNANETYEAIFEKDIEELEDGEDPIKCIVNISPQDLEQMLDNLFANAKRHGFVDPQRKDYKIRVMPMPIFSDSPKAEINILNNGEPVSKSISIEKIFTWGESSGKGSGIGCWQVKKIAEHFDGGVTYNEYPDAIDGFVCEFKIVLPLIVK